MNYHPGYFGVHVDLIKKIARMPLTHGNRLVMIRLAGEHKGLSTRDLADALRVDRASMQRFLRPLIDRKLVIRDDSDIYPRYRLAERLP